MAQTQTPTRFGKQGRMRDYFPASDVYAGDIVVIGGNTYLAPCDIAASATSTLGLAGTPVGGALHVDGTWFPPKDASTFSDGDAVYWNATGNPTVGTAGTGCATSTAGGNTRMGSAVGAFLTGDATVQVLANTSKNTSTVAGSMTADDITGSDSSLAIAGLPGSSSAGGAVPISGGAGNGAGNAGGAATMTGGAGAAHTTGTGGAGGAITSTAGAGGTATSGTGGAGGAGGNVGGAGGLASTSGTGGAGGAVQNTGGVGGSTATGTGGAGGASTLTGGVGGAASGAAGIGGAGGAVTLLAGAGGATASATGGITGVGGAVSITAGAGGASAATGGQASAAGGAVTITAGASGSVAGTTAAAVGGVMTLASGAGGAGASSGAGGAAGALAINGGVGGAGSATGTGGAGSTVTITGGSGGATSGAGTGGAAGHVNLVPGTGGTTSGGTAGATADVQFNGVAGTFEACWQQSTVAAVPVSGSSYVLMIANRAYRVKAVRICCSSTGTVPTVDVRKDTGTTAPGSGTTVLTGVATFSGTANTVVSGALVSTAATLALAAGDRLTVTFGGTVGSIINATVSVLLAPI